MTSDTPQNNCLFGIRKKYRDAKRSLAAAGNAPVSDPAGRALVLRVAGPVTAVTTLATGALFHMYEAAKAQAAFIDAHNLSWSPPDPAPALAGSILGAGVTLLLVATMAEVATGTRMIDLPRLAAVRVTAAFRASRAAREVAAARVAATASALPSGRRGLQNELARRLLPERTA